MSHNVWDLLYVFQATLQQQLDSAQVEHKQALMLKDLHIKRLEHQLTAQVCLWDGK